MGGVLKAVTSIFQAPKVPKIKPVTMPDPASPASKVAARRKIESRRKDGRAGTIYTQNSSGAYAGSNLAGTQ